VTRFAALLRSINVGGRNRLPMADLRALVESLGFEDVTTYLQSGNVVFSGPGSARATAQAIQDRIAADAGLAVPVVVRSGTQLADVVRSTPYGDLGADLKTLHVTFLDSEPGDAGVRELRGRADEFGADRFEIIGTEVYLHCPGGYGETKLNNSYLERRLGVTATTRNWRTVTALADLAAA
jgi:uncharacterized protein (DUF1697 family)